jgi:hypothetical protein
MLRFFFRWQYQRRTTARSLKFDDRLKTGRPVDLGNFLSTSAIRRRRRGRWRPGSPRFMLLIMIPLAFLIAWVIWESIQVLGLF